ncbi:hypothetical protein RA280_11125 [Cupriavidus sp. CV2]|uniref:hypothetical protein n=1 Tax=Cupriavidus ulmosensis TaxID=3065913 RepID=UPI00296B4907|nr:hypothetical protein [Cupriavidus sp. CV2]MDW3682289.1 hypothetical protein [Cupriavidus sp. CV2]
MRAQCCRLVLAAAGCALGLALNVAPCFAQAGGGAQAPFVQIGLARQVAIQVPKDWTILSGAQGRAHGTIADAVGGVSIVPAPAGQTVNLLHAVSNVQDPRAAVIVNSIAQAPVTPKQVRRFDRSLLQAYGASFERRMRDSLKTSGREMLSIDEPRLDKIGGWPAIAISYVRTGAQGTIYVQHFDIYTPDQELLLILSCRDTARGVWLPLLDRVRNSIVVGE